MAKVTFEKDAQKTIDINDCKTNYIYIFEDNQTFFILKCDYDIWYFTELIRNNTYHIYTNCAAHHTVREANSAGHDVQCFKGENEFYEWITNKPEINQKLTKEKG